ncbi:class III lanthionine synthetase LanKC N-terminal domain-containing protein [Luteibacter yeojuensis]
MESSPFFAYSFMSPIYHENIYSYEPSNEFLDIVRPALNDSWRIKGRGFWASCSPGEREDLEHGWKIHVSSTQENAAETLSIVTKLMAAENIAFKFCADRRMLKMSLGKGWSRFQIGKFIAIYPKDVEEFARIIDELHVATTHLVGPYILTDRPYRNSKVVYYRYGVHRGKPRVDSTGRNVSGFFLEDGSWYNDIRGPSFRLPPGITDPFIQSLPDDGEAKSYPQPKTVLLKNRFLVQGAIKFNATGGIYRGVDTESNREVIIREVRGKLGHLEVESPDDPTFILKREAKILRRLSHTGLVPEYIDLFKEWDHWFLVVEKLDAISLWGHSMEFYFSNEYQSVDFGLDKILSSIKEIAHGLQAIHSQDIVLRDLTKNNILFTKTGDRIKFIDFEFAFELGDSGPWVAGWTPGYASVEQASSRRPTIADDCYAFGVLILDMLTFCAAGLELGRDNIFQKLKLVLVDLGLPLQLMDIVSGLTHPAPEQRWSIAQALSHLESIEMPSVGRRMFPSRDELLSVGPPTNLLRNRIATVASGLCKFLDSTLDLNRDDRLWPAAPEVFVTNAVSLEYGASGVALFLLNAKGYVSPDVLDWIERKEIATLCPPGLYSGMCGVAILLLKAGRIEAAHRLMEKISSDALVFDRAGLYYGSAGVGLTNLHFWVSTGERRYLDNAMGIGNWLTQNAVTSEKGVYWRAAEKTYLGLGEGQSGVALFLTYLSAATNCGHYADVAASALDFDISHARRVAGRLVWKVHAESREHAPNLPHVKYGSAGVGSACIRHFALTGNQRFKDVAIDCAHTVRTRMSNKIWQDEGSAGYGEFLLDMATFLDEPAFRHIAFFQAEAIVTHALERPDGTAFGGLDHYRICADYSYGSSGIGMFLDRLMHGKGRFLMLDDLLKKRTTEERSLANAAVPQGVI